MNQMPESTTVFDSLNGGLALQIDGVEVNIAELRQDVDSLKSIIARLISKTPQQEGTSKNGAFWRGVAIDS